MIEDQFRALMACPACEAELVKGSARDIPAEPSTSDWSCRNCGARYDAPDDIPNLRLPGDLRVDIVRRFYEETPFPGYPPHDTLVWLRARAGRSEFARLLDRAIPATARIVEVGCGTG